MSLVAPSVPQKNPRWWRRFLVASRRANFILVLEIAAVLAVLAMLVTSYLTMTSGTSEGRLLPSSQVAFLLIGTLIPSMSLLVLFGRRLALRRAGDTTARLHVRLVFFFSMVAAVPTLLVAAFAAVLFQSVVDFWFSDSQRGILENANELARNYYDQNQQSLENNTIAMAGDLRYYLQRKSLTSPDFPDLYYLQAYQRELNQSAIIQLGQDGVLRTPAIINPEEGEFAKNAVVKALPKLNAGEKIVVIVSRERIEAVAPIDGAAHVYLYNARNSDALALTQWQRAQNVLVAYDDLASNTRSRQLKFNFALFFVSLSIVGLAIWFALRFSDRQVRPLAYLVGAAKEVGAGNFALRVEGRTGADEIGQLNRAFNRMTAQIEKQTTALVGANSQLDQRRAFVEALLESTTAGIISIDHAGRVLLINRPAQAILCELAESDVVGTELAEVAPQIFALCEAGLANGIVTHSRGGDLLTLAVKIVDAPEGRVVTFEDITRQLLDQRQAAWSDVARRIAHEIKNPLTPIQLATERLKRRYRRQIESDGELFDDLTDTIVRQVGDLRKMVDEFSSFARLPKPVFRNENIHDLARQALFLQEVAHPQVDFGFAAQGDGPVAIACDRHQIGQALTNLLKNAVEAVDAKAQDAEPDYRGRVTLSLSVEDEIVTVTVEDNGVGLPQDRDRIVEPYVTTREKGTGLGLAIVNKIVEEHGGEMSFAPAEPGGTRVTLRFHRDPLAAASMHGELSA